MCSTCNKRETYGKYCKKCRQRLWQQKNRDKINKISSEWQKRRRKENPKLVHNMDKERSKKPRRRFNQSKQYATRRGIEWKLSYDEFLALLDQPCSYCSNLLEGKSETRTGLDRINSDGCYEIGNVIPCCKRCNYIKSDYLSYEETVEIVSLLLKLRGLK